MRATARRAWSSSACTRPSSHSSMISATSAQPSSASASAIRLPSTTVTGPGRRTRTTTGPRTIWSTRPDACVTSTSAKETMRRPSGTSASCSRRARPAGCRRPGRDTDHTPLEVRTPESYLGYLRIGNYTGSPLRTDRQATYRFPASLTQDSYAYAGTWKVEGERIVAEGDARLRLNFTARKVHLVLTGRGLVAVKLNGRPKATVRVNGDRLYTLVTQKRAVDGL